MDGPLKWPGYIHTAFIVDNIDALVAWLDQAGIRITAADRDRHRRDARLR